MKALVLSGGSGTRLRPITYALPKQLVPVAGRPVLEHVLEKVASLGVREAGVVVGERAEDIAAAVGDGARFGLRLTYLHQDRPLGLAHCVRLARSFLGEDDFVLYLGDIVVDGDLAPLAADFARRRPDAQVLVRRAEDPRAFGVVERDAAGRVVRLVEKPERPRSDLVATGVYFFTPAVHEAVAAVVPSARGELEITDALQWLVDRGRLVEAPLYEGFWKDTGRAEDVLACNRHMLARLRSRVCGVVDADSELVGEVVLEESAQVVRSRIVGPAVIGAGTVVEDSQVGPYTTFGRGCTVRASRLADSIVLDGASLLEVSGLYGSLIGRGSSVAPGGSGEGRHRLVVGDHVRIEIAA